MSILARSITDYENPKSIASRLRARRIAPLLEMIEMTFAQTGRVLIVDVGGTEQYWGIAPPEYLKKYNVHITVVNLPSCTMPTDHGRFKFVAGDGCSLHDFGTASFDIAHSNSVVEHVGDWEKMKSFAAEVQRIAPKYFVQTPNYWFPIEAHTLTPFFHWFSKPVRVWLVRHLSLGNWSRMPREQDASRLVESVRLLDERKLRALFDDADVTAERILGLPKSLIAIKKQIAEVRS